MFSTVTERQSDVVGRVAGANAHQNVVFVISASAFDRVTDLNGISHALSGDFKNHVAFLKSVFGGCSIRIQAGHHHAGLACARGGDRQAELGNFYALSWAGIARISLRFLGVGQLAKRQADDGSLSLMQHVKLDRVTGFETADGTGKLPGVLDRRSPR